ncbi:MAG: putative sulfate exporter family transporter [Candidatus Eisenbacteria bacterium]
MLKGAALVLPLTLLAWYLAPLPGLQVLGPLGLALLLAALTRAAIGLPAGSETGVRFFARPLLRAAIVIMGVRLDFEKLVQAGPRVLAVDVLVVFLGVAFVGWMGGRMGVRRPLALLLGVGTSVCGASAIAAAGPLVRAEEDDVAVSIGLVSLLGTIGVVAYPALGRLLHLADAAYALLCGATLHEVPQVLAAAFARGQAAGDFGTLVKLTRVALLAPLALGLSAIETAHGGERISWRRLPVPWFVVGFVAVGALRSLGAIPASIVPGLELVSKVLLVAAMAAVGLGVHAEAVKRLGWSPIALALLGWLFVITTAGIASFALGLLG